MSFALKPINKKIQKVLERKSKIFSRDTSALKPEGGMADELKKVQGRTTWIRWISGGQPPIVILGGVAHHNDAYANELAYSLAEGFDQVYVPPNTSIEYNATTERGHGFRDKVSSKYFKPLAGIKSITSGFSGAQKALRDVVVNWSVFDLDELEILTPHFLSPGKWTMLEVGWNYADRKFKNDGLIGSKLLANDFTFTDFESMEEIIYAQEGDYEVFTGIIKNFEYSLRDDGGFDCTTTFGTHGTSLLDAGKDTTNYTQDRALELTELSTVMGGSVDKDVKALVLKDNLTTTINRLASYFRFQCLKNQAFTGYDGKFPSVKDTVKSMYLGRYGKRGTQPNSQGMNFYGEPENWFLCAKYHRDDYIELDKDCDTWVRWGWFEDNVLNKFMGYATFELGEEEANLGQVIAIKELKLQFRSIEKKLKFDAKGEEVDPPIKKGEEKESVRILSHPKLLTIDINKFIFVGRTPTLGQTFATRETTGNCGGSVGQFLEANDKVKKFVVEESVNSVTGFEEGYLRNIYFNTKWLVEQLKGVLTLREALDNILNGMNTEYQNYWDFDIVGDEADITIAKIVDKNNSRYSVDSFTMSDIDITNPNPNVSTYSCYQFPTWTKNSIVSNMEYSVTIPSSMVAVAALSGGTLGAEDAAHRGKGDVNVQQFSKSMRKSFADNKDRFFENIGRITDNVDIPGIAKFGQKDADPNKPLKANEGVDIIMEVIKRDKDLANPPGGDKEIDIPDFEGAETVTLKNAHPYFSTSYTQPDEQTLSTYTKMYSYKGRMWSDSAGNNLVRTMMNLLHSNRRTAKTKLADLLNGIAEIKLTIDGTAGIFPGDAFTSKHLPNKLVNLDANGKFPLVFQTTNVEQNISPDGWKTVVTGQPRLNSKKLYEPVKQDTFGFSVDNGVILADTDQGRKLARFQQTRNILGINGHYLNKYKMYNGIVRVSNMDPYWKDSGEDSKTQDNYINKGFSRRWPLSFNAQADGLKGSSPYANRPAEKELVWTSLGIDPVAAIASSTGMLATSMKHKGKRGHAGTGGKKAQIQKHPESHPMAIFKNMSVQKAMWYSMYNAILYAMPPERSCYTTIDPWISMDKSFRLASYFLFVSDDVTGVEIPRWEKLTQDEIGLQYSKQFVDKVERELKGTNLLNPSGKLGWKDFYSPVAFLRKKELKKSLAGHDLNQYQRIWKFRRIIPKDIPYEPSGTEWKDNDMTVQVKLTSFGLKVYRDFFTTMYKNWIQDLFESKISLNKKLRGVVKDRDQKEHEEIVNAYANMFVGEGIGDDVSDLASFDPLNEIDTFLNMMEKQGFHFAPLYISKLCGNQDSHGSNNKLFMEWIEKVVGDTAYDWAEDEEKQWHSPDDKKNKELYHTQAEGFLGIGASD